jgi:K+-sensing histidine kinase KdpD
MSQDELQSLVASLQRGTLRLTRLIDNLLESVRIESGQLSIRRQTVVLPQVVEDAAEMLTGLFTQRRQTLEVELPPDLPVVEGRCAAAHAGVRQSARQRQQVRARGQPDPHRR